MKKRQKQIALKFLAFGALFSAFAGLAFFYTNCGGGGGGGGGGGSIVPNKDPIPVTLENSEMIFKNTYMLFYDLDKDPPKKMIMFTSNNSGGSATITREANIDFEKEGNHIVSPEDAFWGNWEIEDNSGMFILKVRTTKPNSNEKFDLDYKIDTIYKFRDPKAKAPKYQVVLKHLEKERSMTNPVYGHE